LGSILAWTDALIQRGKVCQPVCIDPVPDNLDWLPHAEKIKHEFVLTNYDLVVICDAAAKNMIGFDEIYPELFDSSFGVPIINIDHHGSNEEYGNINIIRTNAAATTCILTELFQLLNWKITTRMATCLLTGLYTDTGSFMHSNTNSKTLRVASALLAQGANLRMIRKHIFKTTQISTLKLWGRVLQNIYKNEDGVTVSVVTENDFSETGAHFSELSGVVDYVNSVPNSNFSIILTERDGKVKGSLRTLNNDVDLSEIAGRFGGGGHKKAAGFTLPGRLEREVKWTIVN
jgi:bifunctional oligoribonuclease and PAP phosphatase NrnA